MGSDLRLEQAADRRLAREVRREARHSTMTSTISTFTHREPKAWKAPHLDQPMLVKARDLKPLGEIHGWYTLPGRIDGDLCERPVRLTDRDVLPNAVLCQHDDHGERTYSVLDLFAPGSYEKFLNEPARRFGPPAPAALRFADALPPLYAPRKRPKLSNRIGISTSQEGIIDGRDREPIIREPQVRLWGAAAILADLARRGIVVTLGTDRMSLPVQSRGTLMAVDRQTLRDAAPLLLAHLRGDPPPECNSAPHTKGQDASAVSAGPLGNLICRAHLAERVP